MSPRPHRGLLVPAIVALLVPATLEAQVRRGRASGDAPGPWAPATIGAHFGYDDASLAGGEILGLHAHVPVIRSGRVVLMPSAEMTFLRGAKEYQYSADLIFMSAGREGGAFIGGGMGLRDSVIEGTIAEPRKTFTTYSIVAGLAADAGPVRASVQIRWLFLSGSAGQYKPRPLSIGVAYPLWGRS